jgi:hypothetical protein
LNRPFFDSLFFRTFNALSTSLSKTLTSKNDRSLPYKFVRPAQGKANKNAAESKAISWEQAE